MSRIVTEDAVATTGPDVEPVRNCMISVSLPSVMPSLATTRVMSPVLLLIATDPEFTLSLKSAATLVPLFVQYSVPVPKFVVVTVNVTV